MYPERPIARWATGEGSELWPRMHVPPQPNATAKRRWSNGGREEELSPARRQGAQADRGSARTEGEDPDLAGIKLGPQPLADWQIDDVEVDVETTET